MIKKNIDTVTIDYDTYKRICSFLHFINNKCIKLFLDLDCFFDDDFDDLDFKGDDYEED